MKDIKSLLQVRKQMKAKKPHFVMQDAHKLKRLKDRWTKPRGIDSKIRLGLKGYNKNVEPGYRSPKDVRGLDRSGLESVMVCNVNDLSKIDNKKQGAVISGAIGNKKRLDILKKAKELNVKVLNIISPDNMITKIEQGLKSRQEEKQKAAKKKEEKKKDKKEAKETKDDKLAEKITEEEKVAAEKKEKDKILTKKEI